MVDEPAGLALQVPYDAARDRAATAYREARIAASDAREAALIEPRAIWSAARKVAQETREEQYRAIYSYSDADGMTSEVEDVMRQLRERHRELCRVHRRM